MSHAGSSCLPLDAQGLWVERRRDGGSEVRPALFLDRDGTLVEETAFLRRPEDVRAIPGAARAVARANSAGYLVVMVTNQSGVGRGLYSWREFAAVQNEVFRQLAAEGADVDMVVACPYHADGIGHYRHREHAARKPAPGMLLIAGRCLPIDFARSSIVGDRTSDLAAGRAAGIGAGYLVGTGYGAAHRRAAPGLATPTFRVTLLRSLSDWEPDPVR